MSTFYVVIILGWSFENKGLVEGEVQYTQISFYFNFMIPLLCKYWLFIYLYIYWGREGGRGRETLIDCLLHEPWPGTKPASFPLQDDAQPTEPQQGGAAFPFFNSLVVVFQFKFVGTVDAIYPLCGYVGLIKQFS